MRIEELFSYIDTDGIKRARSTSKDGDVYKRYGHRAKVFNEFDVKKFIDNFVGKIKCLREAAEYEWNNRFYEEGVNEPKVVLHWRTKPEIKYFNDDNIMTCHFRIFVDVKLYKFGKILLFPEYPKYRRRKTDYGQDE